MTTDCSVRDFMSSMVRGPNRCATRLLPLVLVGTLAVACARQKTSSADRPKRAKAAVASPVPATAPAPAVATIQSPEAEARFRGALERGRSLSHRGAHADAIAAFEQALAAKSDDPTALCELGWSLFSAGQLDRASNLTWRGINLSSAGAVRAACWYNQGRIAEARHPEVAVGYYCQSLRDRESAGVRQRLTHLANLFGVWGASANDVWVLGYCSAIFHWDGLAWSPVPVPPPRHLQERRTTHVLTVLGGIGTNDLWVGGHLYEGSWNSASPAWTPEALHWDGHVWSSAYPLAFDSPCLHEIQPPQVTGFWGNGAANAWIVGDGGADGVVNHWNGRGWSMDDGANAVARRRDGCRERFRAVWQSAQGDVWLIGERRFFHRDRFGAHWTSVTPAGSGDRFNAIWGSRDTDVWAVGRGGAIVHWDGQRWSRVASGTTRGLHAVSGGAPAEVWAVGAGGVIVRWDGRAWTVQESHTRRDLYGVWADVDEAWAVGERATLLHFDGTSWATHSIETQPPAPERPVASLRDADWRNRTYRTGEGSFALRNGEGRQAETTLEVLDVAFGDLNADGIEEAVVSMGTRGMRSYRESWADVYGLRDRRPVFIGRIDGGDACDGGGLDGIRVSQGHAIVRRLEPQEGDEQCRPSKVRVETWVLRNNRMVDLPEARGYEPNREAH